MRRFRREESDPSKGRGIVRWSSTPIRQSRYNRLAFQLPSSHSGTEASPATPWQAPMSERPSRPSGPDPTAVPQALIDRVLARVQVAGLSVDRRAKSTRPRASRRRTIVTDLASASGTHTPEQVREAQSLRRVFEDLGISYRRYRRETGAPVSPEVRTAASNFRLEPSVTSLAMVAARLDELDILTW